MHVLRFTVAGLTREDIARLQEPEPERTRSARSLPQLSTVAAPAKLWLAGVALTASIYTAYQPGQFSLTANASETYDSAFEVAGTVANPRIKNLVLTVNGERQTVPVADGRFQAAVQLAPGTNTLKASVGGIAAHLTPGSNILHVTRRTPGEGTLLRLAGRSIAEGGEDSGSFLSRRFRFSLGHPPDDQPDPNVKYGILGGGGYYLADIVTTPRWHVPGDGTFHILLGQGGVTTNVIERRDPSGLAILNWSLDLMDLGSPASLVTGVRVGFGGEVVAAQQQAGAWVLRIPEGASRVERLEIDWQWKSIDETVVF